MGSSKQPMLVEITRGPVVESYHHVMAVVVNEAGSNIYSWGNPQYLTMPRSAIKMLQALPLIESGAADHFQLEEKHIALACSSHRGEKIHTSTIYQWMEKVGVKESDLACGPHWPSNDAAAHEMIRAGHKPTAICNNCSGKHTGFLATCTHLKEPLKGYHMYEHPEQKRLRQVLTETMKVDVSKAAFGIDGCSIPTYAVPLKAIAAGMSALIDPKQPAPRKAAAARILRAVRNNPVYLSGTDDFTSTIIEKTEGRSIIKNGAEGCFAGVIPEKGLAFAVKAADGASRAAQVATASLLLRYGGLTEVEFKSLQKDTLPSVKNWSGEVVGQMRVAPDGESR